MYFLGPVFNSLAGAWLSKMGYLSYLKSIFAHGSLTDLLTIFVLYPLAGLAILAMKNWSFAVYLTAMAIGTYGNYSDWRHYSDIFTLPVFIATTFVNVGLVSYFLLPAVRSAYFNSRLRWWESKPRYQIQCPALFQGQARQIRCTMLNLSEGGAFIKTPSKVQQGFETTLFFKFLNISVALPATVVHVQTRGVKGLGLQFRHTDETEDQLREITDALRTFGMKERAQEVKGDNLKLWTLRLLRTGKGLVPEISGSPESGEKTARPKLRLLGQYRKQKSRKSEDKAA
ncbi:MAG: hypothetical protein A2070_14165 [Bdellovibrionales bacterium GWC1_52_8]|nr:MAG: hypothetical protein A2070_14165 [Bdellovibrionales bacterium GWC1_52_8]